jgi:hypothetical protein
VITDSSRVPLGARAWIGDGTRGALVAADGTIDWYCPSGFGGLPAYWRLLDPAGGALRIGPERSGSSANRRLPPAEQRYRPDTNVIETIMSGRDGRTISVCDALPWPGPGLDTPGQIVRVVRALSGPVEVEVEVLPAGLLTAARDVAASEDGLVVDEVAMWTGFRLESEPLDRNTPRWRGVKRLEEGEGLVLTVDRLDADRHLSLDAARQIIEATETAWRSWLAGIAYDGAYGDAVRRSLLAVRSLTGPGGAPVAAGTTSLPRRVGSERNSDDRWVAWRDAAAASRVLAAVGLAEDAEAAERWLRRAVSDAPLPWPAALDPDGQPVPDREELGLAGWRRSQPVVVGRPAGLVDLDGYGDVVGAIGASMSGPGGRSDDPGPLYAAWPALAAAADWVADHWHEPDAGVWQSAGPPGLLVASRVQAWYGLDRMARLARAANPLDLAAVGWQEAARAIVAWLETDGLAFDGGLRRDGAVSAGDEPDAALLRITWRGPWPANHPIVRGTVERILDRLSSGRLVYRYSDRVDDGRAGPDSPDLVASLWAVRALAGLERWDEAYERMEAVAGAAGSVGLLSEAADPVSGELLGNLPYAAAHLAFVEAALALAGGPR